MLVEYEIFKSKLNKRLFDGSAKDLLEKIAQYPDRYVGIFRPTKPKTKLIQNITQSHEIKFGDALEEIFEIYFNVLGFELLPKILPQTETTDNKAYNIDQLFKKGQSIYLIEQKVRDDHDSTKKVGQFTNFEKKYFEVSRKYAGQCITPVMWFIDPSIQKNKNYYLGEMSKMANSYGCSPKLCYGEELFTEHVADDLAPCNHMWNEIIDHLTRWKEELPDMPEVNFDLNSASVFTEIKDISPSVYRRIFDHNDITEQILPILFPECMVLRLLRNHFQAIYDEKQMPIYKSLCQKIDDYTTAYSPLS